MKVVRQKSIRQWFLLAEAGLFLILARFVLKTVPTIQIVRWVRRPIGPGLSSLHPQALEDLRWAVTSFSRNAPIRLVCFPQAIAMHAMLRRRRIVSEIIYGVARMEEGKLVAHAWLRSGDRVWLGGEVSPAFTVLDVWKPAESAARMA